MTLRTLSFWWLAIRLADEVEAVGAKAALDNSFTTARSESLAGL